MKKRMMALTAVAAAMMLAGSAYAADEILIGAVVNGLFCGNALGAKDLAIMGQHAENRFFGKPCGLMDQMACSVGSFVAIDFADPDHPVVEGVPFDFGKTKHHLVITDTKADHADLTDEYASIRREMEAVAGYFGKTCLRETDENAVLDNVKVLRETLGERPVLRALHFYNENRRVDAERAALAAGDFETFKALTIESGLSSFTYNQNVYASSAPASQPVALALALSESVLKGKGAWRVHGGGFAGTIQAFVPDELLPAYKARLEAVFGEGACYVLEIRPFGGTEV